MRRSLKRLGVHAHVASKLRRGRVPKHVQGCASSSPGSNPRPSRRRGSRCRCRCRPQRPRILRHRRPRTPRASPCSQPRVEGPRGARRFESFRACEAGPGPGHPLRGQTGTAHDRVVELMERALCRRLIVVKVPCFLAYLRIFVGGMEVNCVLKHTRCGANGKFATDWD